MKLGRLISCVLVMGSAMLVGGGDARADDVSVVRTRAARAEYGNRLAALERTHSDLAERYAKAATEKQKARVRRAAAAALLAAIRSDLFPAWAGTPWDFDGTTSTPGTGGIACGYYVSTILRDAGFEVERARLAQQPSERIVTTLVPPASIWRFRTGDVSAVLEKVRAEGEGLYVVGLDTHVGFLDVTADAIRFCHASYVGRADVRCEAPEESPAFASRYHVVGRLFTAPMLTAWLVGSPFETNTK